MKHIFKIILVSTILLWSITSLHAEESKSVNLILSPEIKSSLEQRLAKFFDRVETYSVERQSEIYTNIQTKIPPALSRFETQSPEYQIINVVALFVSHRMSLGDDISNTQILRSVIYNESITSDDANSSDNQSDTDNQDNENIVNKDEVAPEYRADLDTDELNEVDKNILAGTAKGVLNLRVRSNLEGIKSETVEFRFNENIDNIGLIGKFYHNWILVWESSQSDATGNVLTIDNISNFIIDTETSNVQLEIVTQAIGKEQVWKTLENIRVVSTTFKDNSGVITGDKVWDRTDTQNSKNFNIVPADIIVSSEVELEKYVSTASIKITPTVWNNNENGNVFSTSLESVTLQVNSLSDAWTVSIFNSNGVEIWTWNISSAGNTTISVDSDNISSSWEVYRISTTAKGTFTISQNWISYSAGNNTYTSNLESQIFLGQR